MTNTLALLYRFIEEPALVQALQKLEAKQFLKLINHVGAEDAGQLLAIATQKQLGQLFDEAFWKNSAPGQEERFDPEKFALWLEIIYEHSPKAALQYLVDMDDELLLLGLAGQILVVDYEELALRMENAHRSFEDDLLDKVLDSDRLLEWQNYLVISRGSRYWDALIALLLELDSHAPERVGMIMATLNHISTEYIEDNGGLYQVLSAEEMLETDLAAEREERREQQGYVSPEAASAFLQLAAGTPVEEIAAALQHDYLTQAYFRRYKAAGHETGVLPDRSKQIQAMHAIAQDFPDIYQHLAASEVIVEKQRQLIFDQSSEACSSYNLISRELKELERHVPEQFACHLHELGYLVNVLIAGTSSSEKQLHAIDAAQQAMEICQIGLKYLLGAKTQDPGEVKETISRENLIKLFRLGWNLQH